MPTEKQLTLKTVVVRRPELIFTEIDNDIIILSIANSKYYGADSVGRRIWILIDQPIPISDICNTLLKEFAVDRQTCERETLEFLQQLLSEQLIEVKSE